MKKLFFSALLLGFIATSCGSKEPQMSENRDSAAAVDTVAVDSTTSMENPDTGQMPVDSTAMPAN